MEVMGGTGGLGLTALPVVIAASLAHYAHAMNNKGVLS
jgi:hypothetical protein